MAPAIPAQWFGPGWPGLYGQLADKRWSIQRRRDHAGFVAGNGLGPATCTVVEYQLQSNGSLLGTWTDLTSLGQGTETASPAVVGGGLAGNYTSVGTNPDASPYVGSLLVTPHGPVYQFQWQSGSTSFDGVGVQQGSSVAAGYDQANKGAVCGVALFSVASTGALTAIWGEYGTDAQGTESWVKQSV